MSAASSNAEGVAVCGPADATPQETDALMEPETPRGTSVGGEQALRGAGEVGDPRVVGADGVLDASLEQDAELVAADPADERARGSRRPRP